VLTEFNFEQQQFASEIEQYNSDRKDLDKQITKEAFLQIEENKEQERFSRISRELAQRLLLSHRD
jgi:single-stranded-DNA-specific exonuclease